MKLSEIGPYVEAAWSLDTSYTPEEWTPSNPSRGQCAVTSVYLVRLFGGELRRGWVEQQGRSVRHYWCVIDGNIEDWTWQQFEDPRFRPESQLASESDLISDDWMRGRYELFAARVNSAMMSA